VSIVVKDRHGQFTKRRREHGPDLDPGTARYYAVVRNTWQGFKKRADAVRAERRAQLDLDRVDPAHAAMTIADFGETVWLPVKRARLKASSLAECEIQWRSHIKPGIGDRRLRDLRPGHLRDLYATLEAKSHTAAVKAHRHLVNLLGLAVDDGYIETNAARVRDVAPRSVKREMGVWDATQVRAFLATVVDDRLYGLWRLTAMTGMRRAEVAGLHWSDVDLDARTVHITRTLVAAPDGQVNWETPKTDRSRRVVEIDAETVRVLRDHRRQQAAEQLRALGAWPDTGEEAGLCFTDEAGQPLRPPYVSRRFGDLVRRVEGLPVIRFHDLRHTHATVSLLIGVPVHVVAGRLGHASPSMTLDVYAHVLREQRSDAAARFADAIDGGVR
jgi:integrase